jgi:glycosyltransferase involved in cell wall biosynthesis
MPETLLSITIPTYNRRPKLQQTLDIVVPQLTDEVELFVSDNCSPDDTWKYLGELEARGSLRRLRYQANIGSDRNMVGCIENARGRYVWLLCDDDKPCTNAVECILDAIKRHDFPPMLYLRATGSDSDVSSYDSRPVSTGWTGHDRNSFLREISYHFTFAPSNVVRRDVVDLNFIKRQYDTCLVAGSLCLSSAARGNRIFVSDQSLLYARGGNNGGYDGCAVFTKNVLCLLRRCHDELDFDKEVLKQTYNENLAGVVVYVIRVFPLSPWNVLTLFHYGFRYNSFYSHVMPELIRRAGRRREFALSRRLVRRTIDAARGLLRRMRGNVAREV